MPRTKTTNHTLPPKLKYLQQDLAKYETELFELRKLLKRTVKQENRYRDLIGNKKKEGYIGLIKATKNKIKAELEYLKQQEKKKKDEEKRRKKIIEDTNKNLAPLYLFDGSKTPYYIIKVEGRFITYRYKDSVVEVTKDIYARDSVDMFDYQTSIRNYINRESKRN